MPKIGASKWIRFMVPVSRACVVGIRLHHFKLDQDEKDCTSNKYASIDRVDFQ